MLLEQVCAIYSGFSARARLEPRKSGLLALQQGCVTASGGLDLSAASYVSPDTGSPHHYVSPGDVLFRSRGGIASAWAVDASPVEAAIALLPLYILRPTADVLDAGYLAWLLMQPAAQAHFARESVGSNIQMIKKPAIAALPVDLPPIGRQRQISTLAQLARRQQSLEKQLTALRSELIAIQLQAFAGEPHDDRNA